MVLAGAFLPRRQDNAAERDRDARQLDCRRAFADVAEKEGFKEAAQTFRMVAKAEAMHEERYRKLLANVENDQVFKKADKVKWMCRKCGYIHEGPTAPKVGPTCTHPQSYFQVFAENY